MVSLCFYSFIVIAAMTTVVVDGHGFLKSPRSHNWLAYAAGMEDCPHCLNGGEVGTVQSLSPNQAWPFPPVDPTEKDRHGRCGGPAGSGLYEEFGTIPDENQFQEGAEIEVDVTITAHHKGHVEFRLCEVLPWTESTCDKTPADVTQDCLNTHVLLRTTNGTAGTKAYDSLEKAANDVPDTCPFTPVEENPAQFDSCYPERFYLGDRKATPKYETPEPDKKGWKLVYKVKLPDGVTCKHCVLQFYYLTSNDCNPPGYRPYLADQGITPVINFPTCGTEGANYPEEFWNCASIAIRPIGVDPEGSPCGTIDYGGPVMPPVGSCNSNGQCDGDEDCSSCSDDCKSKTSGNPSSRYCCKGDGSCNYGTAEHDSEFCDSRCVP